MSVAAFRDGGREAWIDKKGSDGSNSFVRQNLFQIQCAEGMVIQFDQTTT
jgi:hypothetical protein